MNTRTLLLALSAVTATTAAARPVLWAGHLEDDDGPVASASVSYVLRDGEATILEGDEIPTLVDGDFVLEFEIPDELANGASLTLQIVANGQDFGPQPFALTWPRAAFAELAGRADVVDDADLLGGVNVVSHAALAAGDVDVDFAHVVDFPAPFLDGDQGLAFTPSARFTFVGGALALADGALTSAHLGGTFAADDIANETVTSADLANNSVNSAEATNVPPEALVADTLRASAFSAAQNRTTLFEITNTFCANVGTLTTVSTCIPVDDCAGIAQRICTGACSGDPFADTTCDNAIVGDLVFK